MTAADAAQAERVRGLVRAMAPDQATPTDDDQRLVEDLGFDSLRLMELTVVLERAFDLPRYRPTDLVGVRRVGEVVALVERSVAEAAGERRRAHGGPSAQACATEPSLGEALT
ncbi:phosphopantetheine-binding protein [Nocardia sp. NPDC049190]|uniref:acyl carrier protein n=1 Tax=Nocardia sp. NPDC049190 TaxID=3155650 RepID=UPI0033C0773A